MLKLLPPFPVNKILLHSCCAPCSAAIIECLLANGIRPTVFYHNPNIFPLQEYEIRKNENIRFVTALGLDFIDADYDHSGWLKQISGMENEPECGKRCRACFRIRLEETARCASENNFTLFTTSLASSRWKNLVQITEAGRKAMEKYPDTTFWEQNWRKGGLSERRRELLVENAFYNQNYCGCEFSMRLQK